MSWDVFIQDLPAEARTVGDIPDDFAPAPIGRRSFIIEMIKEVVPSADFSDPACGVIEGPDYWIDVSMGEEEETTSVAFHTRGSDKAAGIISDILRRLNMRALDAGTGEFFDHDRAAAGLRAWRQYRDQILKSSGRDK